MDDISGSYEVNGAVESSVATQPKEDRGLGNLEVLEFLEQPFKKDRVRWARRAAGRVS